VAAVLKGCRCVQLFQWWMDSKTYMELTRPWYGKSVGFPFSLYWPLRKQNASKARLMSQFGTSCISEAEIETLVWTVAVTLTCSFCPILLSRTHTQRYLFSGPFSGTTRVSRYQEGKTNLDFTEARDSEWQWHQLGHIQVCTSLQTDNLASTPPVSFLQARCPSYRPANSVRVLKAHYVV